MISQLALGLTLGCSVLLFSGCSRGAKPNESTEAPEAGLKDVWLRVDGMTKQLNIF